MHIPAIVEQIVGRSHVSESFSDVLDKFIGCLKPGAWEKASAEDKHQWSVWVVEAHKANRALYTYVMKVAF
jgi:hypothetical protein